METKTTRSLHLAPHPTGGWCLRWRGGKRALVLGRYSALLSRALRMRDERGVRVVAYRRDGAISRMYE